MSTLQINIASFATDFESDSGPPCERCTGPTRLIGIEPHPVAARTDLRTYHCLVCDHAQASVVRLFT